MAAPGVTGVLTKERRVRVLEVGASECVVESAERLEVRTVGRLLLHFGSEAYVDDVQVVDCRPLEGAAEVFNVRVRFLWPTSYHAGSIRHGVSRPVAMLFERDTGRVM